MIVVMALLACEPVPSPPAAPTAAEAAEDLRISVQAWRRVPDDSRRGSVTHAVERALSVPEPSAELDLAIADAQANIALDPLEALPRFERSAASMTRGDVDHWLDALLRAGDLRRLSAEHERWLGGPLDLDHPLAKRIAVESTVQAELGWRDAVVAVVGARLVESTAAAPRTVMDLPTPGAPALLEALGYVSTEAWSVAAARPANDGDTWLIDGGRSTLIDVASEVTDLADLRRPGVVVALEADDAATLVVGSGLATFAFEVSRGHVVATTDPSRTATLVGAANAMAAGRLVGEVGLRERILLRDGEAFRAGR